MQPVDGKTFKRGESGLTTQLESKRASAERPPSAAAQTTQREERLADENNAIRGRLHGVVIPRRKRQLRR